MNQTDQENIFNVHSLGSVSLPPDTPIETAILQKVLLDLYTKKVTGTKHPKLLAARLTLQPHGIIISILKGKDEYFPLKSIFSCSALIFTGSKVKTNKKKSYTYFFDNIKPAHTQSIDQNLIRSPPQWNLVKSQKYLLKIKHLPLIACLFRSKNKPIEIHVFVCPSNEKALSFSYSVDLARRTELEQPSPVQENYAALYKNKDPFNKKNFVLNAEPELPEVIRKLESLGGGKGTVISPVVKTTNVNLIENKDFYHRPSSRMDKAIPKGKSPNSNLEKNTKKVPNYKQVNNLSVYPANSFEDFFSNKEFLSHKYKGENVEPPSQLSVFSSYNSSHPSQLPQVSRRKSQNFSVLVDNQKTPKPTQRSTTFMPRDMPENCMVPDGFESLGESKMKPVAKVQPHKVAGVKVFPNGYDKTFLLPDRDKLKKVPQLDELDIKNFHVDNNVDKKNNQNKNFSNGQYQYYNNYNNKVYSNRDTDLDQKGNAKQNRQAATPKNKTFYNSVEDLNGDKNINKSAGNLKVYQETNENIDKRKTEVKEFKDVWWLDGF